MPDFLLENDIKGHVCGIDEVGRGPLAGPVVAASVYIPERARTLPFMAFVTDSKKLSKAKLKELSALIREHCHFSVAHISPEEIDRINIFQASLKAMSMAFKNLSGIDIQHALIDGKHCPKDLNIPSSGIIKGDLKSKSIAAASILAKYERDQIMIKLAEKYPFYGWETNAGYPTKKHIAGIHAHGITEHHRKSFKPVAQFLSCVETTSQTRFAV